jgi:hypothetical protein
MKTVLHKTSIRLIMAFSILIFFECSRSPSAMAGGASTTEVGGIAVDEHGLPVADAVARLRPINYVASTDSADSLFTICDVLSDSAGRYHFKNVKPGRYCIECIFKDSLGFAIYCTIDSGKARQDLPNVELKPMAVIVGSIPPSKPDGRRPSSVHAMGMDHEAQIDSTGHFIMKVPEGQTRLLIEDATRDTSEIDTLPSIKSGQRFEWNRHDGLRPPTPDPLTDSSGHQQHSEHRMNRPWSG